MVEVDDIRISDWQQQISIKKWGPVSDRALQRTITDIAKQVEKEARKLAPIGVGFAGGGNFNEIPGRLKAEGIIRLPTRRVFTAQGDYGVPGSIVEPFPAFGGGHTVRGGNPLNKGQFSGVSEFREPGYVFEGGVGASTVYSADVILNPALNYARFVHEGTGVYGIRHKPITPQISPHLRFRWHGKRWAKRSVKGQKPQPFLTEAYVYVNNLYANARVSELRLELDAEL